MHDGCMVLYAHDRDFEPMSGPCERGERQSSIDAGGTLGPMSSRHGRSLSRAGASDTLEVSRLLQVHSHLSTTLRTVADGDGSFSQIRRTSWGRATLLVQGSLIFYAVQLQVQEGWR